MTCHALTLYRSQLSLELVVTVNQCCLLIWLPEEASLSHAVGTSGAQ